MRRCPLWALLLSLCTLGKIVAGRKNGSVELSLESGCWIRSGRFLELGMVVLGL